MTDIELPLSTRLWFCWACWLRVLFDGAFAARVFGLSRPTELAAGNAAAPSDVKPKPLAAPGRAPAMSSAAPPATATAPPAQIAPSPSVDPAEGALQLLSLLQREGRFVDFLQQDISAFEDVDVGAAARVVHEGCRRALGSHARIVSVRSEAEGARVTIERLEASTVKLTGNVSGSAPYRGVLRHRGWRVEGLRLPTHVGTDDIHVVAPAEVEL